MQTPETGAPLRGGDLEMQSARQVGYPEYMNIPPHTVQRWLPFLVVVFMGLALFSDSPRLDSPSPASRTLQEGSGTQTPGGLEPMERTGLEGSKTDADKEHRMAIFHYNEGNGSLNRGEWQEAVRHYNMALRHDKHLHPVYINLSSAYLKGRRFDEALDTLNTLKSMQPDSPHLYYNLACYHALRGEPEQALEALKQAVKLGFKNTGEIRNDPDLAGLRRTEAYRRWAQETLGSS